MVRKKISIILFLCSSFFSSCIFDAPPIFTRPPWVPFREDNLWGTYVAQFTTTTTDTLWIFENRTCRHVMYNSSDSLVLDDTLEYESFNNPIWSDPRFFLKGYVESFDMGDTESTKYYSNPAVNKEWCDLYHSFVSCFYCGVGFDGHKKGEIYFISNRDSPVDPYVIHRVYKKISEN